MKFRKILPSILKRRQNVEDYEARAPDEDFEYYDTNQPIKLERAVDIAASCYKDMLENEKILQVTIDAYFHPELNIPTRVRVWRKRS